MKIEFKKTVLPTLSDADLRKIAELQEAHNRKIHLERLAGKPSSKKGRDIAWSNRAGLEWLFFPLVEAFQKFRGDEIWYSDDGFCCHTVRRWRM